MARSRRCCVISSVFFFQAEDGIRDLTVTGVQTCALPIFLTALLLQSPGTAGLILAAKAIARYPEFKSEHFAEYFLIGTLLSFSIAVMGGAVLARVVLGDRKSTRLNSSHSQISYAVFCLKKKKNTNRAGSLFTHLTCHTRNCPTDHHAQEPIQ